MAPDPATPYWVVGEVVDGLGLGLANCRVEALIRSPEPGLEPLGSATPDSGTAAARTRATTTDARGGFRLLLVGNDVRDAANGPTEAQRGKARFAIMLTHPDHPPQLGADGLEWPAAGNSRDPRTLDLGTLTLRTGPGLRISVVSNTGAPLRSARVLVQPQVDDPFLPRAARALRTRSGRTDVEGSLLVYAPPFGSYEVLAVADGFAWGSSSVRIGTGHLEAGRTEGSQGKNPASRSGRRAAARAAPGPELVQLVLEPEQLLRGRIRDAEGRVLEGIAMELWPPLGGGPPGRSLSQGDGRFTFRNLGEGLHRLVASIPGRGDIELGGIDPADGFAEVSLPGGATLEGVVLHQGKPVVGADVIAEPVEGPILVQGSTFVRPKAISDGIGSFRLTGLPTGSFRLRVSSDGLPQMVAGPFAADGQPVTINLPMPASASGRVLDAGGRALEDAVIQLLPASHDGTPLADWKLRMLRGDAAPAARTDAAGRFTIRSFEAGVWRLQITTDNLGPARRHILWRSAPREIATGSAVAWPPIRLTRGTLVTGTIRDPQGEPVPSAPIGLVRARGEEPPRRLEQGSGAADASDAASSWVRTWTAVSQRDGSFEIGPVPPGVYRLEGATPADPALLEPGRSPAGKYPQIRISGARPTAPLAGSSPDAAKLPTAPQGSVTMDLTVR